MVDDRGAMGDRVGESGSRAGPSRGRWDRRGAFGGVVEALENRRLPTRSGAARSVSAGSTAPEDVATGPPSRVVPALAAAILAAERRVDPGAPVTAAERDGAQQRAGRLFRLQVVGLQAEASAANRAYLRGIAEGLVQGPVDDRTLDPLIRRLDRGRPRDRAVLELLRTPRVREALVGSFYRHLLSRSPAAAERRAAARQLGPAGDFRQLLVELASSAEYHNGSSVTGFRRALERDLLGRRPGGVPGTGGEDLTASERRELAWELVRSPEFLRVWTDRLARMAGGAPATAAQLAAGAEWLTQPGGFERALAGLLADPRSVAWITTYDCLRHETAPRAAVRSVWPGRFDLVRHPLLRRTPAVVVPLGVPADPPPNPFGNAVSFTEVDYASLMSGDPPPVPRLLLTDALPVPSAVQGLTIELWFSAQSSGVLVGQPMSTGSDPAILAPLLWIDAQGQLTGGLFDSTTLSLVADQTLVTATATGTGVDGSPTSTPTDFTFTYVGAPAPLVSGRSVVDGNWHHVALVVAPPASGNPGQQSLYLDGLLVDTSQAADSGTPQQSFYSLGFTCSGGQVYQPWGPPQVGGTIVPMPTSNPTPAMTYPQGYVGMLDELRAWSCAQPVSAIQQNLATAFTTVDPLPTGLASYYSFDDLGAFSWPLTLAGGERLSGFVMPAQPTVSNGYDVFAAEADFDVSPWFQPYASVSLAYGATLTPTPAPGNTAFYFTNTAITDHQSWPEPESGSFSLGDQTVLLGGASGGPAQNVFTFTTQSRASRLSSAQFNSATLSGSIDLVPPGGFVASTPSTVPIDPFTTVARLPGALDYGLYPAVPFSTPAITTSFTPEKPTASTKVTLAVADRLLIFFPQTDVHSDEVQGTFQVVVTEGTTGQVVSSTPDQNSAGNQTTIVTAQRTGTYRIDITWIPPLSGASLTANLTYQVIPGPSNSLFALLTNFNDQVAASPGAALPPQVGYSDPAYPTVTQTVADPRGGTAMVTLPALWPGFDDTSVFTPSTLYTASDLLVAYLDLNSKAMDNYSGFGDFRVLSTNNSSITDPGTLQVYLAQAFQNVTNQTAPAPPPGQTMFPNINLGSAYETVFAFLYNANVLRQIVASVSTPQGFLPGFQAFISEQVNGAAQTAFAVYAVANGIAMQQYQNDLHVALNAEKSEKGFVAQLVGGALIAAATAALAAFAPVLAGAAPAVIAGAITTASVYGTAAAGGAAALSTIATDLLSTFFPSFKSGTNPQSVISYTELDDLVSNITTNLSGFWETLYADTWGLGTESTGWLQQILSNYGLLQALATIDSSGLAGVSVDPDGPTAQGFEYATYQAIVPAVYKWQLADMSLGTPYYPSDTFPTTPQGYVSLSTLEYAPGNLAGLLQSIQDFQSSPADSPGTFFTAGGVTHTWFDFHPALQGAYVNAWYPTDLNGDKMAEAIAQALFGWSGSSQQGGGASLTPAQAAQPIQPFGGAWYFDVDVPAGGVTTWFDAFVNWGGSSPGYSPVMLLPPSLDLTLQYGGLTYHPSLHPADDLP